MAATRFAVAVALALMALGSVLLAAPGHLLLHLGSAAAWRLLSRAS